MNKLFSHSILGLMLACSGAVGAMGALHAEEVDAQDPPSRVARLSYMKGEIQLAPAETGTWVEAELNRPLTTDDALWTGQASRAELQIGSATVHLDQSTDLSFVELSDDTLQLRLSQGVLRMQVKRLQEHETVEIDTPTAAVSIVEPGAYRVEVRESGDRTVVEVRHGKAEVVGDRQSFTLQDKERAEFSGSDGGRLAAEFATAGPLDDFDEWATARIARAERAVATRYVAADVIGYEDLDEYGDWRSDPDYGYVWFPTRVAAGWAPYRHGRWVWVAPWGWTWVDAAPWGFAPYHYGRWVHRSSRWCWVPGPIGVRPVYAPALVTWVNRPGVSVRVSFDLGWVPLGPREVYVPWHRSSPRYVHNVNVSNTTVINNAYIDRVIDGREKNIDYMNRRAPRGVTAVDRATFIEGRKVDNHIVRVDDRVLREAPIAPNAAAAYRPLRESRLGNGRIVAGPPAEVRNRPAVALRSPARLERSVETQARWQTRDDNARDSANPRPSLRVLTPPAASTRIDRNRALEREEREIKSPQADTARPRNTTPPRPVAPNASQTPKSINDAPRRREDRAASGWMAGEARLRNERRSTIQTAPNSSTVTPTPPRRPAPSVERRSEPAQARPQSSGENADSAKKERKSKYPERYERDLR